MASAMASSQDFPPPRRKALKPKAEKKPERLKDPSVVEVDFDIGDGPPLGLVIDWSMPLPVVSAVVDDTPAQRCKRLAPGMVLIGIKDYMLPPGITRSDVENQLAVRPLHLKFEIMDASRVKQSMDQLAQLDAAVDEMVRQRRARRTLDGFADGAGYSTGYSTGVDSDFATRHSVSCIGSMRSKEAFNTSFQAGCAGTTAKSFTSGMAQPFFSASVSLARSPALSKTFHEKRPELSPLLRFGPLMTYEETLDFEASSPSPVPPGSLSKGNRGPGLGSIEGLGQPAWRWHGVSTRPVAGFRRTAAMTMPSQSSLSASSSTPQLLGGNRGAMLASTHSGPQASWASSALTLKRHSAKKLDISGHNLDSCYMHLVDASRPKAALRLEDLQAEEANRLGPGLSSTWPLHHDQFYKCTNSDLIFAHVSPGCIQDAYEHGIRLRKRVHPSFVQHVEKTLAVPARVVPDNAQNWEISCDTCGEILLGVKNGAEILTPFYYCQMCKSHGNRYEMCQTCYQREMKQDWRKHQGPELHPHYESCRHLELVRRRNLRYAYPGRALPPKDIHAHHQAPGEQCTAVSMVANIVAETSASFGDAHHAAAPPSFQRLVCDHCGLVICGRDDDNTAVFVCASCPLLHKLRFELCEACAECLLKCGTGFRPP